MNRTYFFNSRTCYQVVYWLFLLVLTTRPGYAQVVAFSNNTTIAMVNDTGLFTPVRKIQVSFLPGISINRQPKDDIVDVSFNIIGGCVKEVRGFELGSVFNIERENAGKCQLAGVSNLVGGTFRGLQMAGVLNTVRGDAGDIQMAGVSNVVGGSFHGLQMAGVSNLSKSLNGLQASGVVNASKTTTGLQIAGVVNLSGQTKGTQIAGVVNCSKEVDGFQLSGCANVTSYFKGVQLSVFNFADSCDGVPIGILSFVRKNGYHKIELSGDEIFYTNLALRTGITRFHTMIMAGIKPDNFETPLWAFGYGAGTTLGPQGKMNYDLELSTQHISKDRFNDYTSELCKLYVGIDKKIFGKTSIAVGVTYNFYITDTHSPEYLGSLSKIAPYYMTNNAFHNGINIKTWLGGKIAIRFL